MAAKLLVHLRRQWIGVIALFVALGGTAIATHPGGQNTISTADIQNGQVKTGDLGDGEVKVADIGEGAVRTAELANGEVRSADIGAGQVASDELAANSVGAAKIATGAVRTEELRNGQVQAEDLAPGVAPGASGARAWGQVAIDGTLLRSRNVTVVPHEPDSGIYCIDPGSGIDPTTAVMVVGEETHSNATNPFTDDVSHVEADLLPEVCPAGTLEVETFLGDGSIDGGFNLFARDQSFTFVIP